MQSINSEINDMLAVNGTASNELNSFQHLLSTPDFWWMYFVVTVIFTFIFGVVISVYLVCVDFCKNMEKRNKQKNRESSTYTTERTKKDETRDSDEEAEKEFEDNRVGVENDEDVYVIETITKKKKKLTKAKKLQLDALKPERIQTIQLIPSYSNQNNPIQLNDDEVEELDSKRVDLDATTSDDERAFEASMLEKV